MGWAGLSSRYKGLTDIFALMLLVAIGMFIFGMLTLLNSQIQIVKIRSSVELLYDTDEKGSGIASILSSMPAGRPVMEELGLFFVKNLDKNRAEEMKKEIGGLFSSVYKNGYIVELTDNTDTALRIEKGSLPDYTQGQFVIPKPGVLASGTDAFLRLKI